MNTPWKHLVPLGAFALALGCSDGAQDNTAAVQGRVEMGVSVQGLTATQNFCMTWKLYQEAGGIWALVDARNEPICAETGVDDLSDFTSCYDGRRFLVEYEVTFYDAGEMLSNAVATSGGGPADICVKNVDLATEALLQLQNEGNVGGVNPGLRVDQVCSNDKVQREGDRLISALWLQPDDCVGDTPPDSFCAIATGTGLTTERTGVTADGRTRYIFNSSSMEDAWDAFYMAMEPGMAADALYLFNAPWVLHHFLDNGQYGREELNGALGAWYFAGEDGTSVGFLQVMGGDSPALRLVADDDAACDGALSLDARVDTLAYPDCGDGIASPRGVTRTGETSFAIVFECSGSYEFIPCDVTTAAVCAVPAD